MTVRRILWGLALIVAGAAIRCLWGDETDGFVILIVLASLIMALSKA